GDQGRGSAAGPRGAGRGLLLAGWEGPGGPAGRPRADLCAASATEAPANAASNNSRKRIYVAQVVLEYVDKLADGVSTPHQPGLSYSPSRSVCLLVCRAATLE